MTREASLGSSELRVQHTTRPVLGLLLKVVTRRHLHVITVGTRDDIIFTHIKCRKKPEMEED